jgi:MFS family permease
MTPRGVARRTFRSLRVRNYRLYFWGQVISQSGTWLQSVALAWLVLRLSHSGLALGLVVAAQFAPMLVAGPWGGMLADRADKRRLLIGTQIASGVLAVLLGFLVTAGGVRLWMVFAIAVGLGVVNLVDLPARSAFLVEMVGRDDVPNATSLNGVVMNASRVIGPAIGGVLIASVGIGACFIVDGLSYGAAVAGLIRMRPGELRRSRPAPRERGQLREGLRYAWASPELRTPLLVMALVGTLAFNFSIVLPLLADAGFSAMFSMFGLGAVVGGLAFAGYGRASQALVAWTALAFGALMWGAAVAPSLAVELAVLVPLGAVASGFIAATTSMLQHHARPDMRGRVMSLFMVVFVGTTPLGGPLVGWIAERFGARASIAVGATATLIAGIGAWIALRRGGIRPHTHPVEPEDAAAELVTAG